MQTQEVSLTGSCTFKNFEEELENGVAPSSKPLGVAAASKLAFARRRTRVQWLLVVLLLLVITVAVLGILYAIEVARKKRKSQAKDDSLCYTPECLSVAATILQGMNKSYNPCDNFAKYTCQGWVQRNPVPDGAVNEKLSMSNIESINFKKLRFHIDKLSGKMKNDDPRVLLKSYYSSCMNINEIERNSLQELKALLSDLGALPLLNNWDERSWNWMEGSVRLQRFFLTETPLMELRLVTNPKKTSHYTLRVQPPEYLSNHGGSFGSNDTKAKTAYVDYLVRVSELLGARGPNLRTEVEKAVALEQQILKARPPYEEIYYNYFASRSIKDLETQTGFPWMEYFNKLVSPAGVTLTREQILVVPSMPYFKKLVEIINSTDKRTFANFLMMAAVQSLVPNLSSSFRNAYKQYKIKRGHDVASKPRWEQCIDMVNKRYGLQVILGYVFIDKEFDKGIVPLLKEMFRYIKQAFRNKVTELTWLDEETKQKVREKVDLMKDKMGYPEVCNNITMLKEYVKGLKINGDTHFLTSDVNATRWASSVTVRKVFQQIDSVDWLYGPQIANAFYQQTHNEINILAGILSPPFYYGRKAPRAVNFGGIGTVLAHELLHGFDTLGRMFNKYGVLGLQWWSTFTIQGFKERSQCLIYQYSNYSVLVGDGERLHLDGKFLLPENIADNAGLALAYRGYRDWVKANGEEPGLPGLDLTNDQLLLVSFGQLYCQSATPGAIKTRLSYDTHALPPYRAIGSVSNFKPFPKLFRCPAGAKMDPSKRCEVW